MSTISPLQPRPARAPRTRLSPQRRRAQLLRCAIGACAEHGLARATHAHVAERAGVSVSAVHSYFRSREDLVAATLETVEAELMRLVLGLPLARLDAREALSHMLEAFDRVAREDADLIKVWLDWSTGFRAEVWPGYLRMLERVLDIVQAVLARGRRQGLLPRSVDTRAAARLFVGGGHTIALARLAGSSRREIEVLMEHLLGSVLPGQA